MPVVDRQCWGSLRDVKYHHRRIIYTYIITDGQCLNVIRIRDECNKTEPVRNRLESIYLSIHIRVLTSWHYPIVGITV